MNYYFKGNCMARIFLALTLEKDLNDQIISIKKELKSDVLKDVNIARQRNDYHHLTVYFVGEMEPEQISQMNEGLSTINLNSISRSIELTEISFFPNDSSQVLAAIVRANSHLKALNAEIDQIVIKLGLGSDLKAYKPHITLGRFKERDRLKYEFQTFDKPLKGKVSKLEVFESEFSKGKTIYNELKSFEF